MLPLYNVFYYLSVVGVAILLNQNEYKYQCCGFVYEWQFHVRNGTMETFDAQVWRPVGGVGSKWYSLVGYNTIMPSGSCIDHRHPLKRNAFALVCEPVAPRIF